jgi:hypothetical protein
MKDRLPHYPEMNMAQIRDFDACVQSLPGSWTMTHSFVHSGDPRILQLRWIIPDEPWCNPPGFLAFLDQREHRVLLRCFLNREFVTSLRQTLLSKQRLTEAERSLISSQDAWLLWSFDELSRRIGPRTERGMMERALHFLELQEMIEKTDANGWSQGPQLGTVPNFGATFEWIVQECLQRFHHALARRCVSFQEWQTAHLNDIDVLAFLDNLVLLVECKSSKDFSIEHLIRFVQRATLFPAGLSLLLIDIAGEEQIKKRQQQINALLGREATDLRLLYHHAGSLIVFLTDNLCLANTAGGVAASLEGMLLMRTHLNESR